VRSKTSQINFDFPPAHLHLALRVYFQSTMTAAQDAVETSTIELAALQESVTPTEPPEQPPLAIRRETWALTI
jgi:hypothetical protein